MVKQNLAPHRARARNGYKRRPPEPINQENQANVVCAIGPGNALQNMESFTIALVRMRLLSKMVTSKYHRPTYGVDGPICTQKILYMT